MTRLTRAFASLAFAGSCVATAARAECADPGFAARGSSPRDITARDLIELRTIGAPDSANSAAASPLALSPDGRAVAFVASWWQIASRDYCQALVVVSLAPPFAWRMIDRGGERIPARYPLRGSLIADGSPQIVTPIWAPDGKSVGYLKRIQGVTQIWVAPADGSGGRAATRGVVDVEAWQWADGGAAIEVASRPAQLTAARDAQDEGEAGWLYDDRFWLGMSDAPLPTSRSPLVTVRIATDGSGRRVAGEAGIGAARTASAAGGTENGAPDGRGWRIVTTHVSPSPISPLRLAVKRSDAATIACSAAACDGAIDRFWWVGRDVVFLRREGWDNELSALYRWTPGAGPPRQLLSTDHVLLGCVAGTMLVCTEESSTVPRRIVRIDWTSGETRIVFEPNPGFRSIKLGSVSRLRVRNSYGLESWADLVLPPGTGNAAAKLPMVVVQYHSRGFLRGGTGDEYPIFLFAARGFAVLSVERPPFVATALPALKTFDELNAAGARDWADRRNILSSLEGGVDHALATGRVDSQRIGLTGLSDGATTVQFALVNSGRFAAAAISTCCLEPDTVMTQGPAWADYNRTVMGYPSLTQPDPGFWAPTSLRANAPRLSTPLLMQLADREYPSAIEAYMALREQRQPVEMIVFPNEYHVKVNPVHRLAVYQRSLDWFDFWLRGKTDPDPAKLAQYARWQAMRAARPAH